MLTFRDFMESALYDPDRGYYPTRARTEDFYTAPELHPAFGFVLADRIAELLGRVRAERPGEALSLVEVGCGDGTLATQVARRLREKHPALAERLRFVLVERTRKDLTSAVRRLTAFGLPVDARTGIEGAPSFAGVLYSNELLDALPAHVLTKRDGRMGEVYVGEDGREAFGELSRPELAPSAERIASVLDEGGRHAVSLEAARWIGNAAARLSAGYILTVDYGKRFADAAPNVPRAYRRHRLQAELVSEPGSQDLTAPVDFEALIAAGEAAGLSLVSYQSLSKFLVEGGIEAWFAASSGQTLSSHGERVKLKTLVHPEGMGEAFKVLIQRKP